MRLATAFVAGCVAGALILVTSMAIADEVQYRQFQKTLRDRLRDEEPDA